jgi:pimeloyl-ACP methyl ester carboxylesterase
VLAGPSFGGLYTLTFGARYPDEVAGIVLVDSTAPASAAKPKATPAGNGDTVDVIGRVSALVSNSARLGLGRLYGQFAFGSLPPQSRDEVAPASRPQAAFAERSTSTSQRTPRWKKPQPSTTSPTSHWSS